MSQNLDHHVTALAQLEDRGPGLWLIACHCGHLLLAPTHRVAQDWYRHRKDPGA